MQNLAEEILRIDVQIAALSARKRKALVKLSAANSPDGQITPEGRRDALAEALAEGIVYLGERGFLPLTDLSGLEDTDGNLKGLPLKIRKKTG